MKFLFLFIFVTSNILYNTDGHDVIDKTFLQELMPDIGLTTPEMVARHQYPIEIHRVITSDGYILELHRIPKHGSPVVFLQHGLLCSSAIWVELGPENSPAYELYNKGYDVWMGNARGNKYSKKHRLYNTISTDPLYWDFSWHEMGINDLPAVIDLMLRVSGQSQINYIGHSMGTTMFWVLTSLKPEYNEKIRQMHALAPVAFFTESLNNPFAMLRRFQENLERILLRSRIYEFLPNTQLMEFLGQVYCGDGAAMQGACENIYFRLFGKDSGQLNKTALPIIISHTPAGASTKTIVHFTQQINTGKFRMFDYEAPLRNLVTYGTVSPTEYDLSKILAPVYLHVAENDTLSRVQDVMTLKSRLPNCKGYYLVEHNAFNHMDFLWGLQAKKLVFERILKLLISQN